MLSVRNMLIGSQQQQQQQESSSSQEPRLQQQRKNSVLDISSLLCSAVDQPIQLPKPTATLHYRHQAPTSSTHPYRNQHTQDHKRDVHQEMKEDTEIYRQMPWARHNNCLNQSSFLRRPSNTKDDETTSNNINNFSSASTSISLQPSQRQYHLLNKHQQQRRSSRQNQIESRKIEQELLEQKQKDSYHHPRSRQSSSSSSSSSSVNSSLSISRTNINNNNSNFEDEEEELPLKAKRRRASSKQLDALNKVFERTFFPSTQLRAELGRQLGMSPRTVQIWFQNRRQAIRTRERTGSESRENSTSTEE